MTVQNDDSKGSQIFVGGAVSGCKTAVLTFSDLQTVTVKDVTDLLAARRLLNPAKIERYSLGYGEWRRTARLLPATKLIDIGVRSHSTLMVSWSVCGYGRDESEPSHCKSKAGTTARPHLAYVLVPKAPYETAHSRTAWINGPSHAGATALSQTHSQVEGSESSSDMPISKKPRKSVRQSLTRVDRSKNKRKQSATDSDSDKGFVKVPSRVTKKRKITYHENSSGGSDGELYEELAAIPTQKRVHDSKLSRRRNVHMWALQEEVSYEALSELHKLCMIPRYGDDEVGLQLVPQPLSKYVLLYGPHRITCRHDMEPPADSLVYGGCVVLEYMSMYWSPILRCIIDLEKGKILLWKELQMEISWHAERSGISQGALFHHITHLFNMEEETLEEIYARLRSVTVRHPIPGLAEPVLRHRCPLCHHWYQTRQSTRGIILHDCPLGSKTIGTLFSVTLLSGERDDLRIQVLVPEHNSLRRQLSSTSSTPKVALLALPGNLTADSQLVKAWMDPRFRNVSGRNAPKLEEGENKTYKFTTRDHTFRCVHGEQPPLIHETVFTGCAVLSFFQLFFCPLLKAVVNPQKGHLLCAESLTKVFKSRQHGQQDQVLIAHVRSIFSLLERPEHVTLKLDQPILGLPAPQKVFLCQAPGCHQIFAVGTRSKEHHYGKSPGCLNYPPMKTFAITLWPTESNRFRAQMTQEWINKLPKPTRTAVHSYEDPPHLRESGFLDHLREWKIKDASNILRTIAQLPSRTDTSWTGWSHGSLTAKLDKCFLKINSLLGRYLADSEVRLNTSSPVIRRAVLNLHKRGDTAAIKFGSILPGTMSQYRAIITKVFIIILRFFLVSEGVKNKHYAEDRERCLKLMNGLRKVKLIFTAKQKQIIQDFVLKLSDVSGDVSSQIVLNFIHHFLTELFGSTYCAKRKVDCFLEQVILILSLTPDNKWQSAKSTTNIISAIFRVARATLVNAAFMGSMEAGYKSMTTIVEPLLPEEVPEAEEEDEEVQLTQTESLMDEASPSDTEVFDAGDFNLGRAKVAAVEGDRAILEFFEKHSSFIDLNNPSSLCGRLNTLRTCADRVAITEPLASRYIWRNNFKVLSFTWAFIQEREIDITELHLQIFKDVQDLAKTFAQLFPSDFLTEDLHSLSTLESFIDRANSDSIFTLPENAELCHPLITKLFMKMSINFKMNQDSIIKFLDRSQEFLRAFLSALFMTTGVPPHSWQAAQFRYSNTGCEWKNLIMVDGGHLVFANASPSPQQSDRTDSSVWLLAPQLSRFLLLYLGVMRPVEIALGMAGHYKLSDVAKGAMKSFIFCDPRRGKSAVWNADNVNQILKTRGLKVEAYALRLVFSEIIRVKHKVVLDSFEKPSVLDAQGQHTRTTGKRHYAVAKLQHMTGIQFSECERQLLVCQDIHASCFLVKPPTVIVDKPTATWDTILSHQNYALCIARQLINIQYKLATFSAAQVAVISRMLYRTTPFFFNENENSMGGPTFCDEHLRKLVVELYLGPNGVTNLILISDDEIENLTASAATLMLAAIAEWFSGRTVPYEGVVSLAISSWRSLLEAFKLDLSLIRGKHPTLWKEYVDWLQTEQLRTQRRPVFCERIEEEEESLPLPRL